MQSLFSDDHRALLDCCIDSVHALEVFVAARALPACDVAALARAVAKDVEDTASAVSALVARGLLEQHDDGVRPASLGPVVSAAFDELARVWTAAPAAVVAHFEGRSVDA